jgi:hypothetical protein
MGARLRAKREVWRRLADVVNGAPQEKARFFADLRERRCSAANDWRASVAPRQPSRVARQGRRWVATAAAPGTRRLALAAPGRQTDFAAETHCATAQHKLPAAIERDPNGRVRCRRTTRNRCPPNNRPSRPRSCRSFARARYASRTSRACNRAAARRASGQARRWRSAMPCR